MTKSQKTTQQKNDARPVEKKEIELFFVVGGGLFFVMLFFALVSGINLIKNYDMIFQMMAASAIISLALTRGSNGKPNVVDDDRSSFENTSEPYEWTKSHTTDSSYSYMSGNIYNDRR